MQEKGKPKSEYDHDCIISRIKKAEFLDANKKTLFAWDDELNAKDLKVSSRTVYLQAGLLLCRQYPNKKITDLTEQDLKRFKIVLKKTKTKHGKEYSSETITSYFGNIRELFRWLKKEKVMDWFENRRKKEGRLNADEVLNEAEVKQLLQACSSKRDAAIIHCLYESGCRAQEFLNLKIGSIKIEENIASFGVSGKTGKRQCFLIHSLPTLIAFLNEHPYKNNPEAWLWIKQGNSQDAIKLNALQRILRETGKRTTIKKPIFPHCLRHARATQIAKEKHSEMLMRKMFGWSASSQMPEKYVSLSASDVKSALKQSAGLEKEQEQESTLKPVICPRCKIKNSAETKICPKCFLVLDQATALEKEKEDLQQQKKLVETILKEKGLIA